MDYLITFLPTIENAGLWVYWVVFLIAFLESLAFVGLAIPGSVIIIFAGLVASRGILDIRDLIWFVAIGAVLGDSISFYLGKKGLVLFQKHDSIFKNKYLTRTEAFFKKHGGKSVFLGRFIGPMRPVIPFVAGMFQMETRQFFLWNISGAFSFAVTFLVTGYFIGESWLVVQKWFTIGEYTIVATLTVVVLFLAWQWFTIKRKQ